MRTITPTGYGKNGNPPPQFGSTEAVIDALPADSVLLHAMLEREGVSLLVAERGRADQIMLFAVTNGPDALRAIRADRAIGVAKDAFNGMPTAMYEEMQRILASGRFAKVIWA